MANWAALVRRQIRVRAAVVTGVALVAAVGQAAVTGAMAGAAPAARAGSADAASSRAYRGSDGRIAFVRGGNIFSIAPTMPTASGLKKLTSAGHASGPRWSPNGKQLAYLYRGNLWIMNANGSHKTQITRTAPVFTDSRPTWSPNGRYLAFVKTRRHAAVGLLTRYDTMTHQVATFTDAAKGRVTAITALPAPVAWTVALNASNSPASFILFEGAGPRCAKPFKFCLDAVGFGAQSDYKNGAGSLEQANTTKTRLTDPDWLPFKPKFDASAMTTVEDCAASPCTQSGLELTIGGALELPGAYEGVYNPAATSANADGAIIAFVQKVGTGPKIFTAIIPFILNGWRPNQLTAGTEPDWQPVAPFPP